MHSLTVGLVLGALLLAPVSGLRAQFNPNYRAPVQPTANTQGYAAPVISNPGYVPVPQAPAYFNPYYGYGYGYDPVGGALNGVASVTAANAQYQLTIQQARQQREGVVSAQIDNRRKRFDELRYEQANTPTLEERREMDRLTALQRSRNNPPQTEIWSGQSLNNILTEIKQMQARGVPGPSVPLDDEILRHINLTDGTTQGSVGPFRSDKLLWPLALKSPRFKEEREQIDRLGPLAMRQAASTSGVEDETLTGLIDATKKLQKKIVDSVEELSPTEFIQSRRYANELQDAVRTLQNPNVKQYVAGKWVAKGQTVNELVTYMTGQGLKFAPATSADSFAYTSLYHSMLAFDNGMATLVARQGPPNGGR
jgi:hypothetical protein